MADFRIAKVARARGARSAPALDRLFEAGCTALFLVLIAAAIQAAWPYLR